MKRVLIILLVSGAVSCTEVENTTGNPDVASNPGNATTGKKKAPEDVTGCYMKITGRDTAILIIEQKGTAITGKMLYDNFEKDGSRGTVKGSEEKDILKLWYDFESEGMHSVMEVFFKKDSVRLLRGIGTMNVRSDTTYFTAGVNYSEKEAFNKVDCDLLKRKFE